MKKYSTLFILLLVTEITIALFHFHKWIRGFLGDVLVIPLLYCFIRMVSKLSKRSAIILVILMAFTSEISQYFKIGDYFNSTQKWLIACIGNTFDLLDILAYTLGLIPIYLIEKYRQHEST
jgi:hypothetical protein